MTEKKAVHAWQPSRLILLRGAANLHALNKHFTDVKDSSGLMLVTLAGGLVNYAPGQDGEICREQPLTFFAGLDHRRSKRIILMKIR